MKDFCRKICVISYVNLKHAHLVTVICRPNSHTWKSPCVQQHKLMYSTKSIKHGLVYVNKMYVSYDLFEFQIIHYLKSKAKVAPIVARSLRDRRDRCWSSISEADSSQVTLVINPAICCRYFLRGPRLPSQLHSVTALDRYRFILRGEQFCVWLSTFALPRT